MEQTRPLDREAPRAPEEGQAHERPRHDTRIRTHALPIIGKIPLREIRPMHLCDLMEELRGGVPRAATQSHVYRTLSTMFKRAVREELIPQTPCVLDRSELPKKTDADPEWRAGAVFTRAELERLISDVLIPMTVASSTR